MLEILVVDDECDICWVLEQGLTDAGVRVTRSHGGEDALGEIHRRDFDAAIVDVKLLGASGLEVAHAIRKVAPLPIVMMSGFHYEEDQPIQQSMRRGHCQGFISKPFDLDEVLAVVTRIVAESHSKVSTSEPGRSCDGGSSDQPVRENPTQKGGE